MVAECGGVVSAFVVLAALLHHSEIEADLLACRSQLRGVLLADGQALLVGVGGEQREERLRVVRGEQSAGHARVAVVVVRIDGLVALDCAFVDPDVHLLRDPLALGIGVNIQHRLPPFLVHDGRARLVVKQQIGIPLLLRAGLGLERVDVADVVHPRRGRGRVVTGDDGHPGRRGVGIVELVVEAGVHRWKRHLGLPLGRFPGRGRGRCLLHVPAARTGRGENRGDGGRHRERRSGPTGKNPVTHRRQLRTTGGVPALDADSDPGDSSAPV